MLDDPYTYHRDSVLRDGFAAPIRLMEPQQAQFLAKHLLMQEDKPRGWHKSLALSDALVYEIANHPLLKRFLRDLIGEDIVLWGSSYLERPPGDVHPWHCDMESCDPDGGFVSVWVGLLNTRQESSLRFMRGSHLYGVTVQELAAREQVARNGRDDELVLRLANEQRAGAEIVQPEVTDGEAIVFDGRVWHGSNNSAAGTPRMSLLLQYARSGVPVRAPDPANLEWPFRFYDTPPPVIAISGRAHAAANPLAPAPPCRLEREIPAAAYPIERSLRCRDGDSFTPVPCFEGSTANADYAECHYSVLMPGASPHPPHAHLEEEILVVMDGEGELVVPRWNGDASPNIFPAPAGSAIYYPAYQYHTIRNVSSEPVRYAMLRWKSGALRADRQLTPHFLQSGWLRNNKPRGPISMKGLFEGPTAFLAKLHAHITRVEPGAGYEAHRDTHDVAIFLLEGEVGIMGKRVAAPAVTFLPGGCLHDMRATGSSTAKYLVWELHRNPD